MMWQNDRGVVVTRERDDDAEVERIMAMSEAELRAELEAHGLDWDTEWAKGTQRLINAVLQMASSKPRLQ